MASNYTEEQIERTAAQEWVALGQMCTNPVAQRMINYAWVNKLALNFDIESMGTMTVNQRNGHFNLIDGQHRWEALKIFLGDGWEEQAVQCDVYYDLTDEQEAEEFLKLQERLTPQSFDKFRIAVTAGRHEETEVDRMVREAGLTISRSKDGIGATGTLVRIYRRGPDVLATTLAVIRESYGIPGFQALVIDGVGLFCQRYNGLADPAMVITKLRDAHGGVGALLNAANVLQRQLGKQKSQCLAAAMTDIVNRGEPRSRKLPEWWKEKDGE